MVMKGVETSGATRQGRSARASSPGAASAEGLPRPVLVLDDHATIRSLDAHAEVLLDLVATSCVGTSLADRAASPVARTDVLGSLMVARHGVRRTATWQLAPANGNALRLEVEISATHLGDGSHLFVVTVLKVHHPDDDEPVTLGLADVCYVISARPDEAKRLVRTESRSGRVRSLPNTACYRGVTHRDQPCEECPVQHTVDAAGSPPRVWVLPCHPGAEQVAMLSAERAKGHEVHVYCKLFDDELLGQLTQARLERFAAQRKLTPREKELLELLFLGRAAEEIAVAMDLTVRTVRFHQANLLQKLGADSRLDLLRLLT